MTNPPSERNRHSAGKAPEGAANPKADVRQDTGRQNTVRPDTVRPDIISTDAVLPEAVLPEAVLPETLLPEAVLPVTEQSPSDGPQPELSPASSEWATRRRVVQALTVALGGQLVPQAPVSAQGHRHGSNPLLEQFVAATTHAHAAAASSSESLGTGRLTRKQLDSLAALCERIVPETDIPGAQAANAHRFIGRMLDGWFPDEASRHFLDGLKDLDKRCKKQHGASIRKADDRQLDELLEQAQQRAIEQRGDSGFSRNPSTLASQPFFDLLKWLTLVGFFTSEVGMKEGLGFRIVPGRYNPCVRLEA